MEKLERSIRLAVKYHAGQVRDGENALPYITHPFEVLLNLRHIGAVQDENLLCAAILHDVIEETEATAKKLQKQVGKKVTGLVLELTREEPNQETIARLSATELYELRNRMLLDGIQAMSAGAMAVKLADRLANVIDAKRSRSGERLQRYLVQSEEILKIVPRTVNPMLWDAIQQERG